MPTVFDEFRKEFDKMPKDEQIQLGMAGLVQMYSGGSEGKSQMSRSFPSRGNGGIDEGVSISGIGDTVKVHIESMDERTMDTLVSKMKRQTYNVRIASAFDDLIDPIAHRMNTNMLKNQIFRNRLHYENVLYYRGIIEAVNGLGGSNKENFFEAVSRQYHNFMRHPVWNSMSIIARHGIKPLVNLSTGLLFGFKKKKSDTDRIVDAIEEQTEFQRTGKIERESNAFVRLFRTGIVNSLGRNLGSFLSADSFSINAAREAREKKVAGLQLTMMEKLSNKMFGKYTDVLGKDDRGAEESYRKNMLEYNKEQLKILHSLLEVNRTGFGYFRLPNPNKGGGIGGISVDPFMPDKETLNEYFEAFMETNGNIDNMAHDISKMRRMQASERFMHWLRSGMTVASNTVTTLASAIGGAVSTGVGAALGSLGGSIGASFLKGIGLKGLVRGSIPVSLMWAAFSLKDWMLDKLGFGEADQTPYQKSSTAEFLAASQQARETREIRDMTSNISDIIQRRDRIVQRPDYPLLQGTPNDPTLGLDAKIAEMKRERQRAMDRITQEFLTGKRGGSDVDLINYLQQKEGFSGTAYWDEKQFSIGYGSGTVNGKPVQRGQSITRTQALEALRADVANRKRKLREGIDATLTANQLNALTSLAYNVGTGAVLSSSMVRKLEAGDVEGAANEFARWNHAGGQVNAGLTQRRAEEAAMFRGNFKPSVAPSGPRITDSAMAAANTVGSSTSDDSSWYRAMIDRLDAVVGGISELIGIQEGDGSSADGDSFRNIMGR